MLHQNTLDRCKRVSEIFNIPVEKLINDIINDTIDGLGTSYFPRIGEINVESEND